jgi:7-cyano-7-deazaguanine synthase
MLSLAAAVAQARGLDAVAIGAHHGDHWIYPDCRPRFLDAAGEAIYLGTEGFAQDGGGIHLLRPFAGMSKAEVVAHGVRLGAPLHLTWSCYKGGAIACGRCGTCWERLEAFDLAGASDPILYADHTFWQGGA